LAAALRDPIVPRGANRTLLDGTAGGVDKARETTFSKQVSRLWKQRAFAVRWAGRRHPPR